VAIAVIDEIKRAKLLDHATEVGNYFLAELNSLKAKHASIAEVRGTGLMIGLELHSADTARDILAGMFAKRIVLNRTHETVLRFLPPFLITREHVDQTIAALDDLLTQQEARLADRTLVANN
jgi:acetylornithine aminotransferase/acetylornithine/N-succinyldiaminopimelate aminotransferase